MSRLVGPARSSGAFLLVAAAVAALAISVYNYLTPLTGINGSLGALIVCIASAALIVDGIGLLVARHRLARGIWYVLGFLGAVLTLLAAAFLHAWLLALAMVVVLAGLTMSLSRRSHNASKRGIA